MDLSTLLTDALMALAGQPMALVLAIIVATFVLEDIATITVALLASHMVIDPVVAVVALTAGTILGDLAVYGVARRAAHVPLVARFLGGAALRPVLVWMERHALAIVLVARFTPGLRLPVYAGAGSIGVPMRGFFTVVALSALVWTPGLFWVANTLGMTGLEQLGSYGWVLPAVLTAVFLLAPRIVSSAVSRSGTLAAA